MTVPYAFANLSGNIALAKLDSNFNTPITIGNTSVLLGNTVTTLNNLTLANVTITSGTSNVTNVNVTNVTVTNLTATLANVTTLNVASAFITSANIGTLALTNALPVSSGGTGQVTFPANSVLLGNGTGGIATVAPGNVGNVLTSIGGVWVSNVALSGAAAGANTQVQYNNSGALGASANLTFNGTTLTANTLNLTNALGTTYGGTGLTSFTANGVVYASSSSALATGSALVFDGTNLGVGTTSPNIVGVSKAVTLNTTNGTSGAIYEIGINGTNYAYLFSNASNTVLSSVQNLPLLFNTNNTERARIDSSGNLGLGVTPSAWGQSGTVAALQIKSTSLAASGTNAYWGSNWYGGGFDKYIATATASASLLVQTGGAFLFNTAGAPTAHTAGDPISFTQAMTLDASGNLLVGATTRSADLVTFASAGATANQLGIRSTDDLSGNSFIVFRDSAGSGIGSVTRVTTTNAVVYNTTSDYRLKTVTGSVTGQGSRIDALKPVDYLWKEGNQQARGFLAHEFQTVYPNSVTGDKDAVDADGNPKYQAMQAATSEVIADLVAEIQSLRIRIAQLEAK